MTILFFAETQQELPNFATESFLVCFGTSDKVLEILLWISNVNHLRK